MTHTEFLEHIHSYNERILELARSQGVQLLTATAIITEDMELMLSGGIAEMGDSDTCVALVGINQYFANQMGKNGF